MSQDRETNVLSKFSREEKEILWKQYEQLIMRIAGQVLRGAYQLNFSIRGIELHDIAVDGFVALLGCVLNYDSSRATFVTYVIPSLENRMRNYVISYAKKQGRRDYCIHLDDLDTDWKSDVSERECMSGIPPQMFWKDLADKDAVERSNRESYDLAVDVGKVGWVISKLPKKERIVIIKRYWNCMTLRDLAPEFSKSYQSILNIENAAMYRMRRMLKINPKTVSRLQSNLANNRSGKDKHV